jgi:hypothetical protein
MQKWEYATLTMESGVDQIVFRTGNAGDEKIAVKNDSVPAMDKIGAEGWELCGVPIVGRDWTIVFKRPKQ